MNVPSLIVTILLHAGATGANHVGQRHDTGSRHETSLRRHARAMKPRDDATPRRIMTVAEIAEYLNVHPSTIYKMATKGQIPFFRIGFDYRFHRDAIDKWMTDGTSEVLKKTAADAVRAAPKKKP